MTLPARHWGTGVHEGIKVLGALIFPIFAEVLKVL